ncbi:MAG: hypothetical protein ACAI44_17570 [Candidatus Sericytochromatia bacterium]
MAHKISAPHEIARTGWQPWDLAAAPDGRVFVSDTLHHRVLEISASGVINVAAGEDQPGDSEGRAVDARFREPLGLSWSAQGLLIADSRNRRIRRLDHGEVSSELVSYPLERPVAVAADPKGGFYVGDAGSGVILHKVPQRAPEVLVRLEPFRLLQQIKLGEDGKLYYLDSEGLWRVDAGQRRQLLRPGAAFTRLTGLAFWQQQLWLSDTYAHRLQSFGQSGLEAQAVTLPEGAAAIRFPGALTTAVDGSLLLAETDAGRILRINQRDGHWQAAILAENGTQGFGERHDGEDLSTPHDVLYDRLRGLTLVCDYYNQRLLQLDAKGVATPWLEKSGINLPMGLAQDAQGRIYVSDAHRIHLIERDGSHRVIAGNAASGYKDGPALEARFWLPWGLSVGGDGALYIADHGNHAIRRLGPDSRVSTVAGNGEAGLRNGRGSEARFHHPSDVLWQPDGSLLVADSWNHQLRLISPDGLVSTFAGGNGPGLREGHRFKAQFYLPSGLARGADGTLFVADSWNHRIRRLLPNGQIQTLAGKGHLLNWDGGTTDGDGDAARFNQPKGLDIDASGRLLVADTGNHRIRLVELP